jgi:hypothetical protein
VPSPPTTDAESISNVIMKPFVPFVSNGLSPARYACTSFGMRTKPSFRAVLQYLRFRITTGSPAVFADVAPRSFTSAVFPPSRSACAVPLPASHVMSPTADRAAPHLTG